MLMRWMKIAAVVFLFAGLARSADAPKRLLLVTHAGGFMHDSLLVAEQVLKQIGPQHGLQITCFRFTADPDTKLPIKPKPGGQEGLAELTALDEYSARFQKLMGEPVTREQCGRVNAETLRGFDAVLFFTTSTWKKDQGSHPLTGDEITELIAWVKNGGAFIATHCGSDTLHDTPYAQLVGATFGGHPWVQKVRLRVEDPRHPAARGLIDGSEIFDEIYQFGAVSNHPAGVPYKVQPYSRERLHIIHRIDNASFDVSKGSRADGDYPVSWCQRVGNGRSFYTSLGHHKEVWLDPRFQEHLLGGIDWALGRKEGDATPSVHRP